MANADRLPLPLRPDGRLWMTVSPQRRVLGVVHNITSATRLLDLLAIFDGDERIQVVFSCTDSSALDGGVSDFLLRRGMLTIPWQVAVAENFDLALATNRGGDLHKLRFPLIGAPHGAGYNKYLS
ncbi:hypothetical protein PV360_11180, partial [Streptomyces scabiei]|nr:hypothetical protein [Streptomyces scabiei]MDX3664628.1 hypothetical protein [Streptomyces europaeiscabiei]MDX2720828.1 hypothetical protein [Streptomyces scabiei]MDX2749505.1 hypothetical protein [Streptomyces scabiei]MDX2868419.1 hypothetical protein [Streptomyces scabiei]